MWIVPSNHPLYSAFVPEYLDSKEALKEQLVKSELPLMWRSKPSSSKTWLQRWKRVYWLPHLFGRTLKPSTQSRFEAEYTASLAVIPASLSAMPGSGKEKTTRGTCGHSSVKSSEQQNLIGAFLKTSEDTLPSGLMWSTENFQKWVTELKQEYSVRRKLAQRIKEKGCSSLPWTTPQARDFKHPDLQTSGNYQRKIDKNYSIDLNSQVINWPTPKAQNEKRPAIHGQGGQDLQTVVQNWPTPKTATGDYCYSQGDHDKIVLNLSGAVKMWPTTTQDAENLAGPSQFNRNSYPLNVAVLINGQQDKEAINMIGKSREQLNPAWVAQLMGTTLERTFFVPMVTQLLNKPQNSHLTPYSKNILTMPTKTKKIVKPEPIPQPQKPKTVIEQIVELVNKHIDITEAIIENYSYLTDIGMDTELRAADENLKSAVYDLGDEVTEFSFKDLVQKISDHDDFEAGDIIGLLDGADIDDHTDKLINLLEADDVQDYFINQGYACVKLNNMRDRNKLEEFLKTEIYPNFRDQEDFINI